MSVAQEHDLELGRARWRSAVAEVLAKGWPPVLQYLRELEEQVCGGLMTSPVDSLWCQAREESRGRLVCTAMTSPLQRICGGRRSWLD